MAPQQKNTTKASKASKPKAPQAGIQKSRSTQNKKSGTKKTSTQPIVPGMDPITSSDAEVEGESSWTWTEVPPTKKQTAMNGRQRGRNLVQWNRPGTARTILLNLMYEASIKGIKLPMDAVAHRTHCGASGQSLIQWLARERKNMLKQGRMCPPVAGNNYDPTIRGIVLETAPGGLKTERQEPEDEDEVEGEGNEAHRSFGTGPQIKQEMNQDAMGQQDVPFYPQNYSMAAQQIESQHPQQMIQAPQIYQAPWGPAPPGTVNPMDLQRDSNSPIFADESQRNKSVAHRWLAKKGHILPLISRTPSGDVNVQPDGLQCSGQNQQASFGPMAYGNMIPNNQFSYNYNYEGMGLNDAGRASGSHVNSAQNDSPLNDPTFSPSNERE
ncbi:hypothetical protein CDEST_06768 [Colletotrichum destructivum]|uniref:Uncharacterized protein n=1 Tax=Colletotrichum destructivum TaxID=34406 RepID=A0AAX4IEG3_9PEZI|nr:hypothetical protein CDEST_06768 [Colletotrichum destructivum]